MRSTEPAESSILLLQPNSQCTRTAAKIDDSSALRHASMLDQRAFYTSLACRKSNYRIIEARQGLESKRGYEFPATDFAATAW